MDQGGEGGREFGMRCGTDKDKNKDKDKGRGGRFKFLPVLFLIG